MSLSCTPRAMSASRADNTCQICRAGYQTFCVQREFACPGGAQAELRRVPLAGGTVAVVGDGAVGLLGVLAARELGAERIIAMSRHEPRQALARAFGATDIVAERGDAASQRSRSSPTAWAPTR